MSPGPALPSDRSPPPRSPMVPVPAPAAMIPTNPAAGGGGGIVSSPAAVAAAEMVAKDAIIAWYRGEFAAANAIIDALCNHLTQLNSSNNNNNNNHNSSGGGCSINGGAEYESAFAAIHRRRLNWIPVLQMQKYFSIADVTRELRKVAATKKSPAADVVVVVPPLREEEDRCGVKKDEDAVAEKKKEEGEEVVVVVEEKRMSEKKVDEEEVGEEEVVDHSSLPLPQSTKVNGDGGGAGFDDSVDEDSPNSEITDTGSHEGQPHTQHVEICENHIEDCGTRREQINMTKGFVAKEPVKGHMVNVVKGLKMYDNIFKEEELAKIVDFVYELRGAGQNGELLGETYILFNKQMKGNKREQIHLGVPIFGAPPKDDASTEHQRPNIEPIPMLLQSVVDHLVQWQIIPESRKPNGCIINYFDEGEYSQPYLKPPHVDQPICTLLLSETTLAFGRTLVNDGEGNFKGHLMLSAKEGSVLVMRNNSADMARHVMCPSPNKRVSLTLFRVRPDHLDHHNHNNYTNHIRGHNMNHQAMAFSPLTQAMTLWQPGTPTTAALVPTGFEMIPKYGGVVHGPMLMLAPMTAATVRSVPVVMSQKRLPRGGGGIGGGGTGVFLPWANKGSRKPAKHLPPRAQRSRLLALPSPPPPPPASTTTTGQSHHEMETMSDPGSEMKAM